MKLIYKLLIVAMLAMMLTTSVFAVSVPVSQKGGGAIFVEFDIIG